MIGQRDLGKTGLKVSALGYGCGAVGGLMVRGEPAEQTAWGRVVVGTKVRLQPGDVAEPTTAVRRSLEQSLRRLGRDSVDLVQLHNHIRLVPPDEGGPLGLADVIGE